LTVDARGAPRLLRLARNSAPIRQPRRALASQIAAAVGWPESKTGAGKDRRPFSIFRNCE